MAKHFAHKVDVETTNGKTLIRLPTGECELEPSGGTLELRAAAEDDAGLARVQEVIGSHLARFAREEPIEVTWNLYGGRS
jgi:hypothetical protein